MRLSLVSLCLLSLVACGGDDDGNPMLVDAGPGSGGEDAPPAANCTAAATYGSVTPTLQEAYSYTEEGDTSPYAITSFADLNSDPSPDVLLIEYWAGIPPFGDTLSVPTSPIQLAEQSDYATCGACVLIQTDYTQAGGTHDYLATGGTLQLTMLSPTKVAGTLTNATFQHVNIEGFTSTPDPDGCTSSIGSMSFTADVQPAPANLRGKSDQRIKLRNLKLSR